MPLILGTNSIKDTGYNVANSLRFNDGDSPYLSQTISASTGKIFTLSFWMKKSTDGSNNGIFGLTSDGNTDDYIEVATKSGSYGLDIQFSNGSGGTYLRRRTNRVFRDTSAWYHVVVRFDSTQGTASNRFRLYINGVQETSIDVDSSAADVPQDYVTDLATNGATLNIGRMVGASNYYDGYLCEFVLVDGSSLAPTSFGEFDEDTPTIWKPKDVSDLTFGTNGFYLDFEDSSALGNDAAGSNNFTANNLAATDQSTDTCTNNFCTWNPLANYDDGVAFSEGNLVAMSGTNDQWDGGRATMGFSQGIWYFECLFVAGVSTQYIGVQDESAGFTGSSPHNQNGTTVFYNNSGGEIRKDGSATTNDYGTFSSSEVAGIAIDADNFTISVYKGGSAIVNAYALSTTRTGFLFPFTTNMMNGDGVKVNFGSPPYSESGGNTDANGYGNFSMAVPSGYYSLNTKNLAEFG